MKTRMKTRTRTQLVALSMALTFFGSSVALRANVGAEAATKPVVAAAPAPTNDPFKAFLRQIFWFDCLFGEIEPGHKFFCFE